MVALLSCLSVALVALVLIPVVSRAVDQIEAPRRARIAADNARRAARKAAGLNK